MVDADAKKLAGATPITLPPARAGDYIPVAPLLRGNARLRSSGPPCCRCRRAPAAKRTRPRLIEAVSDVQFSGVRRCVLAISSKVHIKRHFWRGKRLQALPQSPSSGPDNRKTVGAALYWFEDAVAGLKEPPSGGPDETSSRGSERPPSDTTRWSNGAA
jgi:hypothetical protein